MDKVKKPKAKFWLHDPLSSSQRIMHMARTFPPEVLPLIVIVTAGLTGGIVAMAHKLHTDNQLRNKILSF
ncbi:7600_t:CDS:2 [Diversispora eburnea]|uniref:7600_t:CDS:1 n=1 Tax=Diversispora eburnea TaxID=1213867 RepID=A0A9N9FAJ6_9GLOM|nr:7600_t:CDS:2 [Diversispora eburnea]